MAVPLCAGQDSFGLGSRLQEGQEIPQLPVSLQLGSHAALGGLDIGLVLIPGGVVVFGPVVDDQLKRDILSDDPTMVLPLLPALYGIRPAPLSNGHSAFFKHYMELILVQLQSILVVEDWVEGIDHRYARDIRWLYLVRQRGAVGVSGVGCDLHQLQVHIGLFSALQVGDLLS